MFVTVGTDPHPFDRLVGWAARWAAQMPDWQVQIQYGASQAPDHGEGFAYGERDQVRQLLARADLVVCHGGAAVVQEARDHGHVPLVAVREAGRGECADDRQQLLVQQLAEAGVVQRVDTEDAFIAAAVIAAYLPQPRVAPESRSRIAAP